MTITPSKILELCALVADSHGKAGEAVAKAIRAVIRAIGIDNSYENIDDSREPTPVRDERQKYLHRKTVKGHDYIYFRMPDGRLHRLPNDETSIEFCTLYDRLLGRVIGEKKRRRRNKL